MKISKGGNSVTFDGTFFPFTYESVRYQSRGVCEAGKPQVRDLGVRARFLKIQFKCKHDKLQDIRDFIFNVCRMGLYTFTLDPEGPYYLEASENATATVRYWSSNFLEKQYVYHRYLYEMVVRVEI